MPEGTTFTTSIFIPRGIYSSLWELQSEIEELENHIQQIKETLQMYAIARPKDIVDSREYCPVSYLKSEVDLLVQSLIENTCRKSYLLLFQEHLKEHPEKDISDYHPYKEFLHTDNSKTNLYESKNNIS